MSSIKERYTKGKANAGVRMPFDGSNEKEWFHVLGVDSDGYIQAERDMLHKTIDDIAKSEKSSGEKLTTVEQLSIQDDNNMRARAHLVASWSYDEDATEEEVYQYFKNANSVYEQVWAKANDLNSFFAGPSENSSDLPKDTTSSTGSRKSRKRAKQ